MSLKRVDAALKKHKRFLITTHTNPEGDALGSELALYRLLRKLGKTVTIINEDRIPQEYGFLPEIGKIKLFRPNIKNITFDCMLVLDCSDLSRTGEVYRVNQNNKPIINIDHHISNDKFGKINWIDVSGSSTSEMIYRLYKQMRIPLDRNSALCLYVGMLTDTGSFRYTNTTGLTHKAVGELMKFGFNPRIIYKTIYENIPFNELKLITRILPNIKLDTQGRIIWLEIPHNILRHRKLSFDLSEYILTFMRSAKDAQVAVLFKENLGVRNEIRINLRSHGLVDVNKIAQYFGGGGHKTASGATVHGKISQVRKKVLAKIRESLK